VFDFSNRWVLILAAGLSLALACSQAEQKTEAAPPPARAAAVPTPMIDPAAATAEADKVFAERCATCHGVRGGGNGLASEGLVPPPRNFQDPEWQKSVSDEHIEKIVQYGGSAVGKSPAMPGNPDLISKLEVVAALRAHIRALAP
jgi:mono/diheme cytochrome c family protein